MIDSTHKTKRKFSAAALHYHEQANAQRELARILAKEILQPRACSDSLEILEVGCGSGFLTEELSRLFPNSSIDALDLSDEMISEAKKQVPSPNIDWFVADIMSFNPKKRYDLISSSSTFQWILPFEKLMLHLFDMLNPGGAIAFSMISRGTLAELFEVKSRLAPEKAAPEKLLAKEQIENIVNELGQIEGSLQDCKVLQEYPNTASLLRSVHQLGFSAPHLRPETKTLSPKELRELEKLYDQQYQMPNGNIFASFCAVQGILKPL